MVISRTKHLPRGIFSMVGMKIKSLIYKMSRLKNSKESLTTTRQNLLTPKLSDINQSDWEEVSITGNTLIIGCDVDTYYSLVDQNNEILGNTQRISEHIEKLKSIWKRMQNYAETGSQDYKLNYKLALRDLEDLNKKSNNQSKKTIYSELYKHYGFIDKKKISVKEYSELISGMQEEWKENKKHLGNG